MNTDMTVSELIAARVQLGIDYLRNSYGGLTGLEWLSSVDTRELNMANGLECVLGQVTDSFTTSPLVITFGLKQASEWGFYLTADDLDAGMDYDELTAEWRRRIEELKRERADSLLQLANAGLDDSWREDV